MTRLLTLQQAAERLALAHWTVRKWIASGKFPSVKLSGRAVRVREADVEAFIAAHFVPADARLALDGVGPEDEDEDAS